MPAVDLLEPNNLRPALAAVDELRALASDLRADLAFARTLVRTLGPGRRAAHPTFEGQLFPALGPLPSGGLAGRRIAVVASGGSGATAALIGVRRAFEDAGVEPVLISACSGSVLFASLWAAGLSADEMAALWLGLGAADYLDPDWGALARAVPRRFRGFGGLLRGEAIERTYRACLGDLTLGRTKIPLAAVVWNIDDNQVEYLSSRATPTMPVARAVRIAISIPIMVEPVQLGGRWYGDGGIVDIFPTEPLRDAGPLDLVIGTNSYLPEGFAGESIAGWREQDWSILRASGQLRYSIYLALAREHVRALGDRLVLLHPVPHEEVRGAQFYQSFLDRTEWPRYIQLGRKHARAALAHAGLALRATA